MLRRGGIGFPFIAGPEGPACGFLRSSLAVATGVAAAAAVGTVVGLRAIGAAVLEIWKASFAGPKNMSLIATAAKSSTTSNPLKSSISTRYRFGS